MADYKSERAGPVPAHVARGSVELLRYTGSAQNTRDLMKSASELAAKTGLPRQSFLIFYQHGRAQFGDYSTTHANAMKLLELIAGAVLAAPKVADRGAIANDVLAAYRQASKAENHQIDALVALTQIIAANFQTGGTTATRSHAERLGQVYATILGGMDGYEKKHSPFGQYDWSAEARRTFSKQFGLDTWPRIEPWATARARWFFDPR